MPGSIHVSGDAHSHSFFGRIASLQIETKRTMYPLQRANAALSDLRRGELTGTAVLST